MTENLLKAQILDLEKKIENLESSIQDLQAQQLEISNNIITLIQHADTMNNVTDESGMLAQHVTEIEEKINLALSWIEKESGQKKLN